MRAKSMKAASSIRVSTKCNTDMKYFNIRQIPVLLLIVLLLSGGCRGRGKSQNRDVATAPERGIYFWKSIFQLNDSETAFLRDHDVKRLYLKMFDVAPDRDWDSGEIGVYPIATTKFVSPLPEGVSVVPAVYITLEALKRSTGNEETLARQIVERVLAMVSFHKLGPVGMVQFDCDWTSSTRSSYFLLCETARGILKEKGIALSGTVRLHQISEEYYPFDHSVLMLYNTGSVKNPDTRNSIIDYEDVCKYLKKGCTTHTFDLAYPTFSWTVFFRNGDFVGLGRDSRVDSLATGETFRRENSPVEEILKVKALAEKVLGAASRNNIIYHLDSDNLSKYTGDEIESIYN